MRAQVPKVPRWEIVPGYSIARIVNGGWQLSEGHGARSIDADAAVDGLSKLVDAGLTTFDCGDIYVGVEELLGQLLTRHQSLKPGSSIQVHTKLVPDLSALATVDRQYVERIVDRSLRRSLRSRWHHRRGGYPPR